MNLAMFAALGMTDIHEMNALKIVLVAEINGGSSGTVLSLRAQSVWPQALVMIVGSGLGGMPRLITRRNCRSRWFARRSLPSEWE